MENDLKTKTITSFSWKALERGGNSIVQLIVQIVMARLLTPEDFGALAIMLVFVNVGNVFVQSGLNTALVQAKHVDEASYSTVFWMSLVASLVLYGIIFVCAPYIAASYGLSNLTWPLRCLCLILIVNAYNAVQVAKVTRELDMQKTFVATICAVVTSGALGIGAATMGAGLWALVVQQLSYQIVNCIALALQVSWSPRKVFRRHDAGSLFRFGSRLLLSGLLETGYQSLSDLIVGARFSPSALGIMSQGKKYPQSLANALDGAIQPVMLSTVAHVSDDLERAKSVTRRAMKSSCYVVMPLLFLIVCVAPKLIPLLLGDQWTPSVPYMQVFCATYALLPITTSNLQALNGMGRSDLFLELEVIKKAYGIAVLLFCAFVLNDVWLLCCSYLFTGVLSMLVNTWPNRKVLGYSLFEQIHDIAPGFLVSLVSAGVAFTMGMLPIDSLPALCLQTLVFVAVFLLLSMGLHVEAFEYLVRTVSELLSRAPEDA